MLQIGVLALQGAFVEHLAAFHRLSQLESVYPEIGVREVRTAADMAGLDGLVIPGGESTVMRRVAQRTDLWQALVAWTAASKPTMGTCAGLILMSQEVEQEGGKLDEDQVLGCLPIRTQSNYYGNQLDSFTAPLRIQDARLLAFISEKTTDEPMSSGAAKGVFIRAPFVTAVLAREPGVTVLARLPKETRADKAWTEDPIVALQVGPFLALTFHPELTHDLRWHKYFVDLCLAQTNQSSPSSC